MIPSRLLYLLDGALPLGALCVLCLGLWISQSSSLNSIVVTTIRQFLPEFSLSYHTGNEQWSHGKCLHRQMEEVGEYSELYILRAVAVGHTTGSFSLGQDGKIYFCSWESRAKSAQLLNLTFECFWPTVESFFPKLFKKEKKKSHLWWYSEASMFYVSKLI